jgi:hypothetical protein
MMFPGRGRSESEAVMGGNRLRLAGLAAAAALCVPAWGQYAPGDGRKLDNNLQQGSGGVNQPMAQPNFYARNNYITGNVPGLGYFHGNINYRSPDEFQGSLASDPLFRFNAVSTPTLAFQGATPGGAVAAALAPGEPAVTVLHTFAPSSPGNLQPGSGLTGAASLGTIVESNTPAPALIPGYPTGQTDSLGVIAQPNGNLLQVSASPLLGLRSAPLGLSLAAQNMEPSVPVKAGLAAAPETPARPGTQGPNEAGPGDLGAPGSPGTLSGPLAPAQAMFADHAGAQLGLALDARLTPEDLANSPQALGQRVARIQAAMFSPLGATNYKLGEDAYLDILTKMKEAHDVATGKIPAPPAAGLDLRHPGGAAPKPPATPALGPEAMTRLYGPVAAPPKPEQIAKAHAQRDLALRQFIEGTQGATLDKTTAQRIEAMMKEIKTQDDKTAEAGAAEKAAREVKPVPELENLLADLKAPPPITELAGVRKTQFNQLMAEGEAHLANERYIDAVRTFRHAVMMEPRQPLTRVGLVHAEMGAGMIVSAARDLRQLFDAYPQLAALRYDPKLLPPPARLVWVRQQLEDMLNVSAAAEEPALLMAYLGYQVNSPSLVEYGLSLAQARAPSDPLISFLRAVWLKSYIGNGRPTTQPARP